MILTKFTNHTRTISSLNHHFILKNHLLFSIYFITIPTILHYFSLPSIKSSTTSICSPYGVIIFYIYLLFTQVFNRFHNYQIATMIILFFSFFLLLGPVLYRSIDEENPVLSLIQLFSAIIQNGILLIIKNSFFASNITDFLFIPLTGSFFSMIYFFFSSILVKKCDLESVRVLLHQTIMFTKTWPYVSALLRNIIGFNFYLYLVMKKSNLIEFIPYVIFSSGIPLSILILDDWESIEPYEMTMKLLSILLIIIALFVHIIGFVKMKPENNTHKLINAY